MHAAHFIQAGQELGSASILHRLIEGVRQLCKTVNQHPHFFSNYFFWEYSFFTMVC